MVTHSGDTDRFLASVGRAFCPATLKFHLKRLSESRFRRQYGERLVEASERGDVEAIESASKALELRIRSSAKDICDKYVCPPHSTDFGILFLPTEGLFAEIIRRPGLVDSLQRECRIVVTGPTTLLALLNSLRMGFRTLAIQKRSSDVWKVLAAVKAEFSQYGKVLDKVQKKLQEATNTIDAAGVRRRAIDRTLREVEVLPEVEAKALLGLPVADASEVNLEVEQN
jgi:DNA recombination protein RmuC